MKEQILSEIINTCKATYSNAPLSIDSFLVFIFTSLSISAYMLVVSFKESWNPLIVIMLCFSTSTMFLLFLKAFIQYLRCVILL